MHRPGGSAVVLLSPSSRYESECCCRYGDHSDVCHNEAGDADAVPCGGNAFSMHVCPQRNRGIFSMVGSDDHRPDGADSYASSVVPVETDAAGSHDGDGRHERNVTVLHVYRHDYHGPRQSLEV